MKIQIIVIDNDDNVLCKREALTFESAGEDLGKLERHASMLENKKEEMSKRQAWVDYNEGKIDTI